MSLPPPEAETYDSDPRIEDAEKLYRIAAFLAANPRGSRGAHKYVREDFDLDLDEIRERFS